MKYLILLLFILPSFQTGENQLALRLPPFSLKDNSCVESVISMPQKPEGRRIGRLLWYLSQHTILNDGAQGAWPDKQYKKDYSKYVSTVPSMLAGKFPVKGVLSGYVNYQAHFLSSLKYRSGYFITGICRMLI